MSGLPSGTVSLLFSDIDGSTRLLSRIGRAYADALDAQRRVLRKAWIQHGGTEMGTEGDSFFVVFDTAPAAVAAAVQAQRDLASYPWPKGERVRVRMGIHTGSPGLHHGGYVGMDVHRAARVSAAAHGGQVLISDATARLADGAGLGAGVRLRDLGWHQLKDIRHPEHLFQVTIEGLSNDFPALKTLGAASSLPVPATPLVGRKAELARLRALLASPSVRLATLTGPGGSGKTRLAIAVAQLLTGDFPDGVYFVPLAAVTSAEEAWTAIAEALDVPPAGDRPQAIFHHLAHRRALLLLDNLEQLLDANSVVGQLLTQAPRLVVIAASRRPLHLTAEYEYVVQPLGLPTESTLRVARKSDAVQLFVLCARRVDATFQLDTTNVAQVVAVCRGLDGLPLAIELAASRVRLLTPGALLARLDSALEFKSASIDRPTRQQTLRDTIAWSYDLLSPVQQRGFRRLGVFAGGADLDAITAVAMAGDDRFNADPLALLGGLSDTSLISVSAGSDGEPRLAMLETVRAYANDRLIAADELHEVRQRHARYYLVVAETLGRLLDGDHLGAQIRFKTENDNFREALGWALGASAPPDDHADNADMGLRLCTALGGLWIFGGLVSEARDWAERALGRAASGDRPEMARFLTTFAMNLRFLGELDRAHEYASASVAMWRRLGDTGSLWRALYVLAGTQLELGRPGAARLSYEEGLALARQSGDRLQVQVLLANFALFECCQQNYQRSYELDSESLSIAHELGNPTAVLFQQHTMACTLRLMGQVVEAEKRMREIIPQTLKYDEPVMVMALAEDYAAVLADLGRADAAVRLLGAADALRERFGTPRDPTQQAEIAEPIGRTHSVLTSQEWDSAYQAGHTATVADALNQATSQPP